MSFVNIGFGNIVNTDKIVAMISPESAPSKRLLANAKENGMVVDASQGRRTRALIVTEEGHLILSALQPDTIAGRLRGSENGTAMTRGEEDE